jgi:hypothetical protein
VIRLAATASLVAAVAATVLVVRASLGGEAAATGAVIAPCSAVDTSASAGRVTCATRSATLTIAPEGEALPIGRTNARVLRWRLDGPTLIVRLRLRRASDAGRAVIGDGQVYARVDDARIEPEPLFGGRVRSGTETVSLRFRLTAEQARRLRRGRTNADLGIVPYGQLGRTRPARLGIVRLSPACGRQRADCSRDFGGARV